MTLRLGISCKQVTNDNYFQYDDILYQKMERPESLKDSFGTISNWKFRKEKKVIRKMEIFVLVDTYGKALAD